MPKHMLIDASHPEETRVVVVDGSRVEEFDFEAAAKRPLKGNIYLAKVTRVEPSLQAAFVEYGGNRQGFLAFSEIHPDYYQIPVADRMAILQAQTERLMAEEDVEGIDSDRADDSAATADETDSSEDSDETLEEVGTGGESAAGSSGEAHPPDDGLRPSVSFDESSSRPTTERMDSGLAQVESEETAAGAQIGENRGNGDIPHPEVQENDSVQPGNVQTESTGAPIAYQRREAPKQHERPRLRRRQYKIQEVIKRRQVMLVQVVKEERGNKGASLTTFLSLAGRYCVLMPNTPRGGGISRKITNAVDRKRLKSAAQSLDLPEGMGLIIRTAGANRTKTEIKRDYEYLLRLWDTVRELTLKSNAPALVYEEGSLIKRAIRDLYSKEISEVIVDGESGYREAKEFMRMLMPSHAKNVKLYKDPLPLFQRLQIESQLDAMFSPVVNLKSGGYVVINQTEALVAIDVNSGRATREHSIEETAAKTNLEAADEIARQLRLRDLAGLIVIDFIDMEDSKNDRNVEKRLHNAVRNDRARIQIGRISQFGLLELSRQRLRAGVVAGSTITCPHCNGQGIIRSTESAALRLLRALDEEGQRQPSVNLTVKTPSEVAIYALNQKRHEIARIEEAYDVAILFEPQANVASGSFEIQRTGMRIAAPRPKIAPISVEGGFQEPEIPEPETDVTIVEPPETPVTAEAAPGHDLAENDGRDRKRRRRRRGGRGRTARFGAGAGELEIRPHDQMPETHPEQSADASAASETGAGEASATVGLDAAEQERETAHATESLAQASGESPERHRRRRRRGRRGRRPESENSTDAEMPKEASLAVDLVVSAGIDPGAAPLHDEASALSPLFESPPRSGDAAAVMPNTPSSPVWSLSDRQTYKQVLPSEIEPAAIVPANETESVSGQPVSQPAVEAVAMEAQISAESAQREIRKGWWQRRFKG